MDFKAIVENATPEQLQAMARVYMAQQAQATFTAAVKIAGIDYEAEKRMFLENSSRTASRHTARTYRNALRDLDGYAAEKGLNVLELKPDEADGFIYWKNHAGASAATVRLYAAAASSFFTFLERRHSGIIANPFRGTKARPAQRFNRIDLPTAADIEAMKNALPPMEAAAVSIMAGRGLRVGSLADLSIKGRRFTTRTKGKDVNGDLSADAIEAVKNAGLELRRPFGGLDEAQLQHAITYELLKAYKAGKVRAAFSPHKLRHYYAATEYRKDKDIRRVSMLLGHSGIAITERYLRGLGELD
jgi:site-specific recombinase XerC